MGPRPAPQRRRRALRRGSGDGHAARAGRGGARRPPPGRTPRSILLDPAGEVFRQARAGDLARRAHLVLVCPRYEGVDDRVRDLVDLELSIGDYVLTGGELPALVVVDAVIRLLPGAIDDASTDEESFADGLLEYPQYTRPPTFRGRAIPDVLVSGNHEAVRRWRLEASLRRTLERRPDLLDGPADEARGAPDPRGARGRAGPRGGAGAGPEPASEPPRGLRPGDLCYTPPSAARAATPIHDQSRGLGLPRRPGT